MKHALRAALAVSVLLATPFGVHQIAFAQASTVTDSDVAPNAKTAETLKNQSSQIHNPTEQNETFKNQMSEQPDPKAPVAPSAKASLTGETSTQMPISSPQHEAASKPKHHHKHSKTTAKSAEK
ncbi:hypothetical protein [Asaia astilbis]|uniref:hypothetical protein n=1 Tax=Asaia astilbis TaxID=610244 RepID=UPI00046EDCD1|nr:hypothetical protein [Asaia astilbis]